MDIYRAACGHHTCKHHQSLSVTDVVILSARCEAS